MPTPTNNDIDAIIQKADAAGEPEIAQRIASWHASPLVPKEIDSLIRTAILVEGTEAEELGLQPSLYEGVLHRDLLFAVQCMAANEADVRPELRRTLVSRLFNWYCEMRLVFDDWHLPKSIAASMRCLHGTQGEIDATEIIVTLLISNDEDQRCAGVNAAGLIRCQSPEIATLLIQAFLTDSSSMVQHDAANALKRMELLSEALASVMIALQSDEEVTRHQAVVALYHFEQIPADAIPGIVTCLNDVDSNIRHASIRALGKLDIVTAEAIQGLIIALQDEDWDDSVEILRDVIAETPSIIRLLLNVIEPLEIDASLAQHLLQVFENTDQVPTETIETLVRILLISLRDGVTSDPEWEPIKINIRAFVSQGQISDTLLEEVIQALKDQSHDSNPRARGQAMRDLESITEALDQERPDITKLFLAALKDNEGGLRGNAADILERTKQLTPEIVHSLLTTYLDPISSETGSNFLEYALFEIAKTSAITIPILITELQNTDSSVSRFLIAEILANVEYTPPEVISVLINEVKTPEASEQALRSVMALGRIVSAEPDLVGQVIQVLKEAATEESQSRLRGMAMSSLQDLGRVYPEAMDVLFSLLNDDQQSAAVQRSAARVLIRLREVPDKSIALFLQAMTQDDSRHSRRHAIEVLGEMADVVPESRQVIIPRLIDIFSTEFKKAINTPITSKTGMDAHLETLSINSLWKCAALTLENMTPVTPETANSFASMLFDDNSMILAFAVIAYGNLISGETPIISENEKQRIAQTLYKTLQGPVENRHISPNDLYYWTTKSMIWDALWQICHSIEGDA